MAQVSQRLKKDDLVRVRRKGGNDEWANGVVVLASGTSVLLQLDGIVRAGDGLLTAVLPLTVDYERETVTGVLTPDEYEVEVCADDAT